MFDLTVDTKVLVIASGLSDQKCKPCHIELLDRLLNLTGLVLAVDPFIESEYNERLRSGDWGKMWLQQLASRNKLVILKRGNLNRGIQTALQEAHFDPGDYCFIRVAMVTSSKILVSEDDDYSTEICTILKRRLRIEVHVTESICSHICANLPENPA